jgi:hypothetical protein
MYLHVRAIERELGLPSARLDQTYLQQYVGSFRQQLLKHQVDFHKTSEERMDRIERRLHGMGKLLFGGTLVACIAHLVPLVHVPGLPQLEWNAWVPPWLTLAAAVLPAFGAATAGIRNQGEFLRVAKRSRAMRERLAQAALELKSITTKPAGLESAAIIALAAQVIQWMVDEVLDWRVVFLDRPLVPPA